MVAAQKFASEKFWVWQTAHQQIVIGLSTKAANNYSAKKRDARRDNRGERHSQRLSQDPYKNKPHNIWCQKIYFTQYIVFLLAASTRRR